VLGSEWPKDVYRLKYGFLGRVVSNPEGARPVGQLLVCSSSGVRPCVSGAHRIRFLGISEHLQGWPAPDCGCVPASPSVCRTRPICISDWVVILCRELRRKATLPPLFPARPYAGENHYHGIAPASEERIQDTLTTGGPGCGARAAARHQGDAGMANRI